MNNLAKRASQIDYCLRVYFIYVGQIKWHHQEQLLPVAGYGVAPAAGYGGGCGRDADLEKTGGSSPNTMART